jgi:hypothetical protein
LFYIGAASLQAQKNMFMRIGVLDHTYYNFTTDYDFKSASSYFPVDKDVWGNIKWTNGKGIF